MNPDPKAIAVATAELLAPMVLFINQDQDAVDEKSFWRQVRAVPKVGEWYVPRDGHPLLVIAVYHFETTHPSVAVFLNHKLAEPDLSLLNEAAGADLIYRHPGDLPGERT